jgi:site-specific DNA recombinase
MQKAEARDFNLVIVESLDRLSRDPGDLHQIHKRLQFLDIDIISLDQGKADSIHVAAWRLQLDLYKQCLRTG